jgi:hypothetical protein
METKRESRWEAEVAISMLFLKLDVICFLVDPSIPHDNLHPTKMDAFFSVLHLQQQIIKQGQWRDAIWIQWGCASVAMQSVKATWMAVQRLRSRESVKVHSGILLL